VSPPILVGGWAYSFEVGIDLYRRKEESPMTEDHAGFWGTVRYAVGSNARTARLIALMIVLIICWYVIY
jgi:hypothetical protein